MKLLRLPSFALCLIHLTTFVAYSSEVPSGKSQEFVGTTVSDFCQKYRSDLLAAQQKWKISMTPTNGIAIIPMSTNNEREASVTIDLEQGQVAAFSAFKGFSKKRYGLQIKDIESTVTARADTILRDVALNTNAVKQVYSRKFSFAEHPKQNVIDYLWQRQTNGFVYKDDFVRVIFDAQDGELLSVRKSWGAPPDSLKVKLPLQTAKEIISKHVGNTSNTKALVVKSAEIAVVSPNDFLQEAKPVYKGRRLAWVFALPKQFQLESPSEIWVDAETGAILGGKTLF